MKFHGLADLKKVQKELKEQLAREAAEKAEREARAKALAAQSEKDQRLFRAAVGRVAPMPEANRKPHQPTPAEPVPKQRMKDEKSVMQEALSDEFDAETLLLTDEHLSFRRPGMGPDVIKKLRQGDWSIQAEIDLHGARTEEAREQLAAFIREAYKKGLRCLRVVHGKGLGSPGKTPVLKSRVHSWLVQKNEVMAFVQARPAEGGAGALVVLLRPSGRVA